MAERWLNLEELRELTGWSVRTVRRKAESGELVFREGQKRLANGRTIREFSRDSLPYKAQVELARRDAALSIVHIPESRPAVAPLVVLRRAPIAKDAIRFAVTRAQKEQKDEWIGIIRPLIEYDSLATDADRRMWCLENDRTARNLSELVSQIAAESGRSLATIWRKLAVYRSRGGEALPRWVRSDKGQSRWFAKYPKAAVLAAYLYLNERQSVSFVLDQIEHDAASLNVVDGDHPSRETVRMFLSQNISPAMKTLARQGEREYRERMAPYLKRGYLDVFANQFWVGDHAIHDVEISNDLFDDVPFGTPGRLRMSAFVDYRSRKAWATWAWEGSSRSIAATMIRAMLEVGPPEGIYVDNGRDYKKVAKGATRGCDVPERRDDDLKAPEEWWRDDYRSVEQTGVLAMLGISVTHCIPRHPQSKHVERFFRTMHMHFDAVHSTYTSGSPFTRPEATEKAMMRHRRLLKAGRVEQSNHPLASRFILGCLSWINEYNNTPQSGEGMDGLSPNQVFEANLNPNQRPVPESDTLALLLTDQVRRRVRECAVTIQRYRYTPRAEDRAAWAAMHESNETEIVIRYNPQDPEFAQAISSDGRPIAWLEAEPLMKFAPNNPATQAQIAESMATRRGLEKATKETLKTIKIMARANGAQSAEEMLYSRLQLPTNTSPVITQRQFAPNDTDPVNRINPGEAADRMTAGLRRMRPDKAAVAPPSSADIATDFMRELKRETA